MNQELEKAGRVADYFELAELLINDALNRKESCGAHFREEYQTPDGEASEMMRNLHMLQHGNMPEKDKPHILHKEELKFEEVEMKVEKL